MLLASPVPPARDTGGLHSLATCVASPRAPPWLWSGWQAQCHSDRVGTRTVASTDATRFATQTQPEAGMFGAEREVFMAVPWPVFWERVEVIFARPLLFCLWGVALASSRVNLFGRGVGLYFMSSAGQAAMRLPKVVMALAILDPLSAVAWAVRFIEWVAARGRPLADGRGLARGRRRRRWQGWGCRRWWWWRWWRG